MPVPSIQNPTVPFCLQIFGGMVPGRMVKIRGVTATGIDRFDVMFVCGTSNTADVGLHLWFRFQDMQLILNHVTGGTQPGDSQQVGLPMRLGHPFELVILCDLQGFNVAVNGHHLTQFAHRMPFQNISHVAATGQIIVHLISFEVHQSHGPMAHPGLPHASHAYPQIHHPPQYFHHPSSQMHHPQPLQYHQPPPHHHPHQQQQVQHAQLQKKPQKWDTDTSSYNYRPRRRRRYGRSGGYYRSGRRYSDSEGSGELGTEGMGSEGTGSVGVKPGHENDEGQVPSSPPEKEKSPQSDHNDKKEPEQNKENNSKSDSGGASDYSD